MSITGLIPRFRIWIAALAVVFIAGSATAQDNVWIQVEARPQERSALSRAEAYAAEIPNVASFRLSGQWYAVAIGPFSRADAVAELRALRQSRLIPSDSFISDGSGYREQIFPPGGAGQLPAVLSPLDDGSQDAPVEADLTEPVEAVPADESPAEARRSERDLTRGEREYLQRALKALEFYPGAIDGDFGPGTRRAMSDWQEANGYQVTGILTTNQRRELAQTLVQALNSLGFAEVVDDRAGIQIDLPRDVVSFDSYDAPFAKYAGGDTQILLISQSGDRNTLAGLFDVMQTLEIVPLDGPRDLGRSSFTLEGSNDRIHSYTYATLAGDAVKGFTVVWPAGDDLRRKLVVDRMRGTFRAIDGVLPDTAGDRAVQRPDLVSGLQVRTPISIASGFFVDNSGAVLTTANAVTSCGRITLTGDQQADVIARSDTLALLRANTRLSPLAIGQFAAETPRLQSEVAVAGYSYGGVLGAPTLTYGTLEDTRGLNGEDAVTRLALNAQPGDIGGPVLDTGGSVVGMLLPPDTSTSQTLPDGVEFAADAATIAAFLAENGVNPASARDAGILAPEDLSVLGADMTVLVECWE